MGRHSRRLPGDKSVAVDGNWQPMMDSFPKGLAVPADKLRADIRQAEAARSGLNPRNQPLINKNPEVRSKDPTSGTVEGNEVTGELGRQGEDRRGNLGSEVPSQRQMAAELATSASGGARVNPQAPLVDKGGNPLENVIAKEVTPVSSQNPERIADLQRQLETRQRDARNAGAFANYKNFVFEKADEILDKLDDPNLDPATRKALELENQKLMSSYTEEVAKERQLNPNFDPVNPEASVQRNLSSIEVLQRELNLGDDVNVDPLFEAEGQTPRIFRDSDVPQSTKEAEDLGIIGDFRESGKRKSLGGRGRTDSDRVAALREFFVEKRKVPNEDEINPATGKPFFPEGKPQYERIIRDPVTNEILGSRFEGMPQRLDVTKPIHHFFNEVDGVPARFKDVDDFTYQMAIYQGHIPGTDGFEAAREGFARTLDRLMTAKI